LDCGSATRYLAREKEQLRERRRNPSMDATAEAWFIRLVLRSAYFEQLYCSVAKGTFHLEKAYFAIAERLRSLRAICTHVSAIGRILARAVPSLLSILAFTMLDVFFCIFCQSYPVSLLVYLPFCLPLEVAFYFQQRRYAHVRSKPQHTVYAGEADAIESQRCWRSLIKSHPPEALSIVVRGWFLGPGESAGEPGVDDVRDLVAHTTFNAPFGTLRQPQAQAVRRMVSAIEAKLGAPYPAGRNPALRCMATYATDELEAHWRPLLAYLLLQILQSAIGLLLRLCGFSLRATSPASGSVNYWHRPARTPSLRSPPLIFFHGVGGLSPYWPLLIVLNARHEGEIMMPIFSLCSLTALPAIALLPPPPTPRELALAVREMLLARPPTDDDDGEMRQQQQQKQQHRGGPDGGESRHRRAAFLAHSFGTAMLGSVLKADPTLAAAATFVDPICFSFSGALVYNFLFAHARLPTPLGVTLPVACFQGGPCSRGADSRRPGAGAIATSGKRQHPVPCYDPVGEDVGSTLFRITQRKVMSEEVIMQDCIRRLFWWSQHWIHPSDLPCACHVILSGKDTVASPTEVLSCLRSWQRQCSTSPTSLQAMDRSCTTPATATTTPPAATPPLAAEDEEEVNTPIPTAATNESVGQWPLTYEYHRGWFHGWLLWFPFAMLRTIDSLVSAAAAAEPLEASLIQSAIPARVASPPTPTINPTAGATGVRAPSPLTLSNESVLPRKRISSVFVEFKSEWGVVRRQVSFHHSELGRATRSEDATGCGGAANDDEDETASEVSSAWTSEVPM
jgi:hypothetical protein